MTTCIVAKFPDPGEPRAVRPFWGVPGSAGPETDPAGDPIFVANAEGVILSVSSSFERETGASRYEYIGRNVASFFEDGSGRGDGPATWDAFRRGESLEGFLPPPRAGSGGAPGEPVGIVVSPLFDTFGRISCFVAVKRKTS